MALACRLDHGFHTARWHLDRVLATGSDDPALWLERAFALGELKHADLALSDLEKALDLKPGRPTEWAAMFRLLCALPENREVKEFAIKAVSRWERTRAPLDEARTPVVVELAARCGASRRWDLATAALEEFVADPGSDSGIGREDVLLAGKYAIALLRNGDQAAYRLLCRKRHAQVAAGKLNVLPLDFLWECVMGPDAVGDPVALVRQAEAMLKVAPPTGGPSAGVSSAPLSTGPAGSMKASAASKKASGSATARASPATGSSWPWPTHGRGIVLRPLSGLTGCPASSRPTVRTVSGKSNA
jgi:hypothetical protein